jgi:ferredoxin-NADP reductase
MAMIRHRVASGSDAPMRLLYSARSAEEIIYRRELESFAARKDGLSVFFTLTRRRPAGWTGYDRRVDRELLDEVSWPAHEYPLAYVCGSTGFVEAVASALVDGGTPAGRIRTERFGPTGD